MSSIILKVLQVVLKTATPEIVVVLQGMVQEFKKRAAATPNPVDDLLAEFLEVLIGKPA